MESDLFGQPLIESPTTIDEDDRIALSHPLIEGAKNIKWSYFKELLNLVVGKWESVTGVTKLRVNEPVKVNTLVTDKQAFSPVTTSQTIDLFLGDTILLDVTGVVGDLTLTLNNPTDTGAWEIIVTQPATSVDIIFPSGTKTLNGSGDAVLGISSATQRILFDYNGSYFTILEVGEVN